MFKLNLFIFSFFLATSSLYSQKKIENDSLQIPASIYYSSFEQKYNWLKVDPFDNIKNQEFKFILFDEDRLESNLSNSLSFSSFGTKPTRFYLDTYKKLYDLKGQTQTFFKVEQLYEVPPKYSGNKRHN